MFLNFLERCDIWIDKIFTPLKEDFLQVFIFHTNTHPAFKWYTQCVDVWMDRTYTSVEWQTAYLIFGMFMLYFLPLTVIVITYSIILFTISRKTSTSGEQTSHNIGYKK